MIDFASVIVSLDVCTAGIISTSGIKGAGLKKCIPITLSAFWQAPAIEAIDTEMGRLFNSISSEDLDNTIVIFVGDNGTPGPVAQQYHSQRAKGSLYKGGINVPMIISGKGVERINDEEDGLISTVDIFSTISELSLIHI